MDVNYILGRKQCPSCGSYDMEELKDKWICHYCYAETLKNDRCTYCGAELYLVDNEVYCAGGCVDSILKENKGE